MHKKTVLIAEDSSVIQTMAKKVLEFQNFKILTAKNGEKVLEILETTPVDAILLDLNMPVMNGEECVKAIRNLPDERSKIPIIAVTGNASNYSLQDFKTLGFNEYIAKPLNFDLLVNMVLKATKCQL